MTKNDNVLDFNNNEAFRVLFSGKASAAKYYKAKSQSEDRFDGLICLVKIDENVIETMKGLAPGAVNDLDATVSVMAIDGVRPTIMRMGDFLGSSGQVMTPEEVALNYEPISILALRERLENHIQTKELEESYMVHDQCGSYRVVKRRPA